MTWWVRSGWSGQVFGPYTWNRAKQAAELFWRQTRIQPHISTQRQRP